MDGFRAGTYVTLYGIDAEKKAAKLADAAITRAAQTLRQFNLGNYTEFDYELLGAGSQSGNIHSSDEVVMKIAVKHPDAKACGIFLKTLAGLGLATPPGLSGFTGAGRAKPSPVFRLFSYLTPKADIKTNIEINGTSTLFSPFTVGSTAEGGDGRPLTRKTIHAPPSTPALFQTAGPTSPHKRGEEYGVNVPLFMLAWGRSGDKGNKANVGIIARKVEYFPYIWGRFNRRQNW